MKKQIKNLTSESINNQIILRAGDSKYIVLPFYKSNLDLRNDSERSKFIRSTELLIRKSSVYRAYIKYLKEDIGLTHCMMFSELGDDMCEIEMHHGPIFNLYDYVSITLRYFIKNQYDISTFSIAKQVLQDHCDNLVQVVMLSQMAHEAVHMKNDNNYSEFLSLDSAWGDLTGYLIKYQDVISIEHINKIHRYMERYKNQNKQKTEVFVNTVKNWNTILEKIKKGAI